MESSTRIIDDAHGNHKVKAFVLGSFLIVCE